MITRKLRSRVQRVKGTDAVIPKTYRDAPQGYEGESGALSLSLNLP